MRIAGLVLLQIQGLILGDVGVRSNRGCANSWSMHVDTRILFYTAEGGKGQERVL